MTISIIVPCFNEEMVLSLFIDEIFKVINYLDNINFEVLFINDGSTDNTQPIIESIASKDNRLKYISFSRNFGKEAAMLAGMRYSQGDYVVIIDADLQHPPQLIIEMVRIILEGEYDCVATKKVNRAGEPYIRTKLSKIFYKILNKFSDVKIINGANDFRLMSRQMVNSMLELNEYNRFSKGIFEWVGFKTKWIEYENVTRAAGVTKWSFWKLFNYAVDGVVSFSTKPLRLASVFGILLSLISFIYLFYIIVKRILFGDPVAGWPSIMAVLLLISGGQFLFTGIIGEYLARTYIEVKDRPTYIVKKSNIY